MSNLDQEIELFNQRAMITELQLALAIQTQLQESPTISAKLMKSLKQNLNDMLYAKNRELFDIHYDRLTIMLNEFEKHKLVESINEIRQNAEKLAQQRQSYLMKTRKYWRFWREESWASFNLTLLILPLALGSLFPVVGIGMLIYTVGLTGISLYDFSQKNTNYWSPPKSLGERVAKEDSIDDLKKQYGDALVDSHLKTTLNQKSPEKMSSRLYLTYAVALVIGLIGLAAFLFPPIGIPTLALLSLTAISIAIGVSQGYIVFQKQRQQINEIKQTQQSITTEITHDLEHIADLTNAKLMHELGPSHQSKPIVDEEPTNDQEPHQEALLDPAHTHSYQEIPTDDDETESDSERERKHL